MNTQSLQFSSGGAALRQVPARADLLPDGKTCGDCSLHSGCAASFAKHADEGQCHFHISKFKPRGGK